MKKLLFLLILVLMVSCEKDSMETDALGENAGIIGAWVEEIDIALPVIEDGITRLNRSEELADFGYGFIIKEDGTFIERKNAGWCGTPPISYDNFEGSWEALSDSLLDITVAYWGGTLTYQMRIVSLEEDKLGIRYLFTEDRTDAR
jgi:hypothetical protein